MTYKTEWRQMQILYCDHCGNIGTLPSMTLGDKTYANCCSTAGHKAFDLAREHRELKARPPYEDLS
jgi:hypothetical protein